ncbi:hypothetical protein BGZ76_005035, partial [Entomortierella beljakovae]
MATKVAKALTSLTKMIPEDSKKLKIIGNVESTSALRELSDSLCDSIREINSTK